MSITNALRNGVIATLQGNAGVSAIVGTRAYASRPRQPTMPFLAVSEISYSALQQDGFERTLYTFQVNATYSTDKRALSVVPLADAVVAALHQANISLADPYGLGRLDHISTQMAENSYGDPSFASIRFEAEVTEA